MYLCRFETRHFSFEAAGRTRQSAWHTMQEAWALHCEQRGADPDYLQRDDCHEYQLKDGEAMRDSEHLIINLRRRKETP